MAENKYRSQPNTLLQSKLCKYRYRDQAAMIPKLKISEGFPGATLPQDVAYESYAAFQNMIIRRYQNLDEVLFTKMDRLAYIIKRYGPYMGSSMMEEVLRKSSFFLKANITSKPIEDAAMAADPSAAFRFCPLAKANPSIFIPMLFLRFSVVRHMNIADAAVSMDIAHMFPYKLAWMLSISLDDIGNSGEKIHVSKLNTNALAYMVCVWLDSPECVYQYKHGMRQTTNIENTVSSLIVLNSLTVLKGLTYRQGKIHELLGMRYRLGVEVRSWANKLQVVASGTDMDMPLYEKFITYTVDASKAALDCKLHYGTPLDGRRGDSMLNRIAEREDLCVTVLPLIVHFMLWPIPPRFKPAGELV